MTAKQTPAPAETVLVSPDETVLVSPDGKREWTPEDALQATNLRARGWTTKAPKTKPAAAGSE